MIYDAGGQGLDAYYVCATHKQKASCMYIYSCTSSCRHPHDALYSSQATLLRIIDVSLKLKLDRKSTYIALGGGVIGDMVGFAAAIYQRGINFVQVSEHTYIHIYTYTRI